MQSLHWVIIGAADDPRVQGFIQALPAEMQRTSTVIGYDDDWQTQLPQLLNRETCLRIESPSHDLNVVRQLTQLGQAEVEAQNFASYSTTDQRKHQMQQGEFVAPHQFYFGLKQRLNTLQDLLNELPIQGSMNHIPDVLTFYDKQACHQRLSQHGIALPSAIYDVTSYQDLRQKMHAAKLRNVFIKTRFGSGASGIIALKTSGPLIHALTTLEQDGERLFNTRRLCVINHEQQLANLVDRLCRWGVHCEAWLPKAVVNKMNSDIRLLVVNCEAKFTVLRKSKTPITNLHLLNQRAGIKELKSRMSNEAWSSLEHTAQAVSAIFPDSFHFALDIAVLKDFEQHAILEINAFGDFLQNINHHGMNSYAWEINQFLAKHNHTAAPTVSSEACQ